MIPSKFLALVEKNEKSFILCAAKRYEERLLYSLRSTTGIQQKIFSIYRDRNPNFGDKLIIIARALGDHSKLTWVFQDTQNVDKPDYEDTLDILKAIKTKYWKRIRAKWERGIEPAFKVTKTLRLKELLARGFIHKDDLPHRSKKLRVEVIGFDLVWPKLFDTQEEADIIDLRWIP